MIGEKEERTDHTGRVFPTITKMCAFWGVSLGLFYYRRNFKYLSVKEALTLPSRGRKFQKLREKYNIPRELSRDTIKSRLKRGWPEQLAYTAPAYSYLSRLKNKEAKK